MTTITIPAAFPDGETYGGEEVRVEVVSGSERPAHDGDRVIMGVSSFRLPTDGSTLAMDLVPQPAGSVTRVSVDKYVWWIIVPASGTHEVWDETIAAEGLPIPGTFVPGPVGPLGPAGPPGGVGYLDITDGDAKAVVDGLNWPASGVLRVVAKVERALLFGDDEGLFVWYGAGDGPVFTWGVSWLPYAGLAFPVLTVLNAAGTVTHTATSPVWAEPDGDRWATIDITHTRSTGVTSFTVDGVTGTAATIPANHTIRSDGDTLHIGGYPGQNVAGLVASVEVYDDTALVAAPEFGTRWRPDRAGTVWATDGEVFPPPVAPVPVVWERFTRPDGTLTDGDRMTSGAPWRIAGGPIDVTDQTATFPTTTGAAYAWTTLATPPDRVELTASFTAGSTYGSVTLLCVSPITDWTATAAGVGGVYINSLHITIGPISWSVGIYDGTTLDEIEGGVHTAVAVDTPLTAVVERIGVDTIALITLDGVEHVITDSRISDYWGPTVGTEWYQTNGTDRTPVIHAFAAYA